MHYLQNFESLNENLTQAKSILTKVGKTKEDDKFKKIAEFTNKDGYIGLITKVVYELGLDIEKAKELYKLLKSKKVDLGNNDIKNIKTKEDVLTYIQKLQIPEEKKEDYEYLFEVNGFLVYRVNSYKGIMEIGSPAWCLKTKSHWENYRKQTKSQSETIQFVVIHKSFVIDHVSLLSVPDNWKTGDSYKSSIPKMRFGITLYPDDEKICIHDDNNIGIKDIDTKFNKFLLQILYKIIEYGKKEKVEDIEFVKKYIKNFTGIGEVEEDEEDDEEYEVEVDEDDEDDEDEEEYEEEYDEEFIDYIETVSDYFQEIIYHNDRNKMRIVDNLLRNQFSLIVHNHYEEGHSARIVVGDLQRDRNFTDAITQEENRRQEVERIRHNDTNTDYREYRNDVFRYIHDDYGLAVNGTDVSDDACELLNGRFNYLLRMHFDEDEEPSKAAELILDDTDFISALENLEEPDEDEELTLDEVNAELDRISEDEDEDEEYEDEEESETPRETPRDRLRKLRDTILGRRNKEEEIQTLNNETEELKNELTLLKTEQEQLEIQIEEEEDNLRLESLEDSLEETEHEIITIKNKIQVNKQKLSRLRNEPMSDETDEPIW